MSDPLTIAADLERCLRRVEDARANFVEQRHILNLEMDVHGDDAESTITQRSILDIAQNRLLNERAEHARLLVELVALVENGGE